MTAKLLGTFQGIRTLERLFTLLADTSNRGLDLARELVALQRAMLQHQYLRGVANHFGGLRGWMTEDTHKEPLHEDLMVDACMQASMYYKNSFDQGSAVKTPSCSKSPDGG